MAHKMAFSRRGFGSGGVFLLLLPDKLGMGAGDEVSGLMREGLEFSVHCGLQFFHILVARFLNVRFPRWCRTEVRFPGCLVRLHQCRRSCQLHRMLQRDFESSDENHDQHRIEIASNTD